MRERKRDMMSHMRFVTPKVRWLRREGGFSLEAEIMEGSRPGVGGAMCARFLPARLCMLCERSGRGEDDNDDDDDDEGEESGMVFRDKPPALALRLGRAGFDRDRGRQARSLGSVTARPSPPPPPSLSSVRPAFSTIHPLLIHRTQPSGPVQPPSYQPASEQTLHGMSSQFPPRNS